MNQLVSIMPRCTSRTGILTELQQPSYNVYTNRDALDDSEAIFADRLCILISGGTVHTSVKDILWVLLEYSINSVNSNANTKHQMD